jgi:hypothetical protein
VLVEEHRKDITCLCMPLFVPPALRCDNLSTCLFWLLIQKSLKTLALGALSCHITSPTTLRSPLWGDHTQRASSSVERNFQLETRVLLGLSLLDECICAFYLLCEDTGIQRISRTLIPEGHFTGSENFLGVLKGCGGNGGRNRKELVLRFELVPTL